MKKTLFVIFIFLFKSIIIFGQTSWTSRIYFNLSINGKEITQKDFKSGRVKLLTAEWYAKLKFDSAYNSFTYTSHNISEYRCFFICTKKDTVKIEFAGLDKALAIISPLEINENGTYSLYSLQIIDFIAKNKSCNISKDGREIFYFDLPKKEELIIDKYDIKYLKEKEITEDD